MKIINIDELKKSIILMLKEKIFYIEKAILERKVNNAFVQYCENNIKKCENDIQNINSKIELLSSLIINNPIINEIRPNELNNIYIYPFSYENNPFFHNGTLKYDFSGLSVKDEHHTVICDIHFCEQHSESILNHYWNLNLSSPLFIGLSSIKNNQIIFYKNKVMTKYKIEKIAKSFNILKNLSKQFTYYNTPIEINLVSNNDSLSEQTKIKYLNNFYDDGNFSICKQLKAFERYYNNNCKIFEAHELKFFLKNIRTIRKFLSKKEITFNFVIDVITNMKPRVYFNQKANVDYMSNVLFIELNKDTNLETFLKEKIGYGDYDNSYKTSYNISEYLKNKADIDDLMSLMQY